MILRPAQIETTGNCRRIGGRQPRHARAARECLRIELKHVRWVGREHSYYLKSGRRTQAQLVVATLLCGAERSSSLNASASVRQPSGFHGRVFKARATAFSSLARCALTSVPFGKYCRSSPLVFSSVPRCHGLRITEVHLQARLDREQCVLAHLGALVPSERSSKLPGQRHHCPGDRDRPSRTTLVSGLLTMARLRRKVQQHRKANRSLD